MLLSFTNSIISTAIFFPTSLYLSSKYLYSAVFPKLSCNPRIRCVGKKIAVDIIEFVMKEASNFYLFFYNALLKK